MKRAAQSPACSDIGHKVLYFADDNDEYGQEASVVGGYQMYRVTHAEGIYGKSDGDRVSYRFGYVIRLDDEDRSFFVAAHQLTRDDCEPAHLCLVTPSHHMTS